MINAPAVDTTPRIRRTRKAASPATTPSIGPDLAAELEAHGVDPVAAAAEWATPPPAPTHRRWRIVDDTTHQVREQDGAPLSPLPSVAAPPSPARVVLPPPAPRRPWLISGGLLALALLGAGSWAIGAAWQAHTSSAPATALAALVRPAPLVSGEATADLRFLTATAVVAARPAPADTPASSQALAQRNDPPTLPPADPTGAPAPLPTATAIQVAQISIHADSVTIQVTAPTATPTIYVVLAPAATPPVLTMQWQCAGIRCNTQMQTQRGDIGSGSNGFEPLSPTAITDVGAGSVGFGSAGP